MAQPLASVPTHRPYRKRSLLVNILTYSVLGLWTFVCLFPLYWVAVTSLKGALEIDRGPFYLPFVDFAPTLNSWAFILTDPYDNLLKRFFNSTVVGLSSTLLTVFLGGMAVYGLTRFRYRLPWTEFGNRSILFAILATRQGLRINGVPSKALSPRPIFSMALDMRPLRPRSASV